MSATVTAHSRSRTCGVIGPYFVRRFASVSAAMRAASTASGADDEVVRIRRGIDTHHRIAYPGDADYADADARTENGLLRWPLA